MPDPVSPTSVHRVITNDEFSLDQRIRMELAAVYAMLHSGGTTESEKGRDVSNFVKVMFPVIKNGTYLT